MYCLIHLCENLNLKLGEIYIYIFFIYLFFFLYQSVLARVGDGLELFSSYTRAPGPGFTTLLHVAFGSTVSSS